MENLILRNNTENLNTMPSMTDLSEKQILALNILEGGSKGVISARKLIDIETQELKDGNKKYLSTTDVVNRLEIENLTTTLFNRWLCENKFGDMKVLQGQKKAYFHPNEKFCKNIARNGYALTGYTTTNKPKISYKPAIMEVLNQNETKQSIINFVHKETINPFK